MAKDISYACNTESGYKEIYIFLPKGKKNHYSHCKFSRISSVNSKLSKDSLDITSHVSSKESKNSLIWVKGRLYSKNLRRRFLRVCNTKMFFCCCCTRFLLWRIETFIFNIVRAVETLNKIWRNQKRAVYHMFRSVGTTFSFMNVNQTK